MPDEDLTAALTPCEGGVRISVRVQPRASRCGIAGLCGNALKIRLTTPPVDGRANAALCDFLAETLNLSRSAVTLVTGKTSRSKIVEASGITPEAAAGRLGDTAS